MDPGKKLLATSTIETYLAAFTKLAAALHGRAPSDVPSDELESVLRGIIQDVNPKSRTRVIRGLRDLHSIGQAVAGLEDVEWDAILSGMGASGWMDYKNVLHEHEVQLALSFLDGLDVPPDYQLAARYCVLVMFWGGLRFGEAFRLRVDDVRSDGLLVRNTSHGETKTEAGRRFVPKEAWSCPDLDGAIDQLIDRVKLLGGDAHAPLCCVANSPESLMSRSLLESIVTAVLRAATGDPSVRPHHLRHAALTRLFGRLVWNGVESEAWRSGEALRKRILGNSEPSRRGLQALAMLAGHADATTTLATYVRYMEFRAAEAADTALPRLPLRLIELASGLTKAQVRKRSASGRSQPSILREGVVALAKADSSLDPAASHVTGDAQPPALSMPDGKTSLPLPRLRTLLAQEHKRGLDPSSLAVVHGIDSNMAARYLECSERIFAEASITLPFPIGNRRIGLDRMLDLVSSLPWEVELAEASLVFCRCYVASSACLSAAHVAELASILRFLRQLGVPASAISITGSGDLEILRNEIVPADLWFSAVTFKRSSGASKNGRRKTSRRFRVRIDAHSNRDVALKNIVEAVCLWRIRAMAES